MLVEFELVMFATDEIACCICCAADAPREEICGFVKVSLGCSLGWARGLAVLLRCSVVRERCVD